jgi:cobalamin biosynthetic protein CobC
VSARWDGVPADERGGPTTRNSMQAGEHGGLAPCSDTLAAEHGGPAQHASAAQLTIESFARHGGRLSVAQALFPQAPSPWIDLSTGINPESYPAPRANHDQRNRLPDVRELARLETVAARAFGVEEPARVVAVGGTESSLRLLPYALGHRHAVVAGPTYGSHADAWRRFGAHVQVVGDSDIEPAMGKNSAALTIVNPNNPDGRLISVTRLQWLHEAITARDGKLIVDEAFGEVTPHASVASIAGSDEATNLIVLRSFGKFYGLAGVRLGFIIAAPALAATLRGMLGDWPVSSDALTAGLAAYADDAWVHTMRARLQKDADRLDSQLQGGGFEMVGGTSLYRLARSVDAAARFLRLAEAGILVRPFAHDATLLRFGLPGTPMAWERVAAALAAPL